jgi:hypothetical protein
MGINIIILVNVVLIPCGIVAVTALLASRLKSAAIAIVAFGCSAAYIAVHLGFSDNWNIPHFPPSDKGEWLLAVAALVVLPAIFEAILSESAARFNIFVFLARAIAMCLAIWLTFSDMLGRTYSGTMYHVWFAGACAIGLLQWELNAALARRISSLSMASMLLPVCVGSGIALALSDTKHGMLIAGIGATAGTITVASWFSTGAPLARGLVSVASPLTYVLVLCGRFFAETPLSMSALLIAAPLAGWIAELPPVKRLRPWQAGLIRMVAVALVVGAAVAIAAANMPKEYGEE